MSEQQNDIPSAVPLSQTTNAPQTGLSSSSVVSLLAVNLFTIILAVWQHWSMASVMWTYWFQSVVIGVFQYKKILDLKEFSTEGFTSNGRRVEENEKGKKMTARFFVIHYGFFHFVYMVFLFPLVLRVEWLSVIPGAIAFFLNHRRSYELHQGEPRRNTPNIGSMMFFPYARIFPMHFILIMGAVFASKSQLILIIFLLLKTGADLLMHVVEHRQKSQV